MAFREKNTRTRSKFTERINLLFKRGPKLDDSFWDDLEESLILSDFGPKASMEIIERLQEQAHRQALPDAYAVLDLLAEEIADLFTEPDPDPFRMNPVCVLFVGINGAGKTTTVGKLAYQASVGGRKVLIGSADTFRAAAIEQLDVWGERSGVEVVKRERGSDPASVCFDVCARAEELGSDLVLIDTSGRLHTSEELMRELQKVVNVTRKHADVDVKTVLVIDATTGQNGLQQAREFHKALDLDGVIMTKLDGTAKGGIAVAVSHELGLPILRVGVGEGIEDLQPFDPLEYAEALFGDMRDEQAKATEQVEEVESILDADLDSEDEPAIDIELEIEPELDEDAEAALEVEPEVKLDDADDEEDEEDEGDDDDDDDEYGFVEIFLEADDDYEDEEEDEESDEGEPAESEVAEELEPEVEFATEPEPEPESAEELEIETEAELETGIELEAEPDVEDEATTDEPDEPADPEELEEKAEEEPEPVKETFREKMRRWFL